MLTAALAFAFGIESLRGCPERACRETRTETGLQRSGGRVGGGSFGGSGRSSSSSSSSSRSTSSSGSSSGGGSAGIFEMVAVEVIWTPAEENDRLSSAELETLYPELRKIDEKSMTGRVFCASCAGPFAAELGACPHCGAVYT